MRELSRRILDNANGFAECEEVIRSVIRRIPAPAVLLHEWVEAEEIPIPARST